MTRQAISRWELDTAKPDADNILTLCDLFGVSADYLLREQYTGEGAHPIQMEKQETALGKFFRGLTLKQWAWIGALAMACLVLPGLRLIYLFSDADFTGGYYGFLSDKDVWGPCMLAWCAVILSAAMLFGKQVKNWLIQICQIEP